jgi:dimethylhistidine N-methyltransferase
MVEEVATGGSVTLYDFEPTPDSLCDEVSRGLSLPAKKLAPKWFYDKRGARLFEQICETEAYYPTRTEISILQENLPEITQRIGAGCRLVEFGSGSGIKTEILLAHLEAPSAYIPVDISRTQLVHFAVSVAERFPSLQVLPVCADYTRDFGLPSAGAAGVRTVAFFPGSTIGNFEPPEAEAFLRRAAALCRPGGAMLIGVDLRKDPQVIEAAYNDPEGITAAFNLNLLERINRQCGADFDLEGFHHHAVYSREHGRIEMRLVSDRAQRVRLGSGMVIPFRSGEHITTEYSYKYAPDGFRKLAERAGWMAEQMWTDARHWFSVWLLVARSAAHPVGGALRQP